MALALAAVAAPVPARGRDGYGNFTTSPGRCQRDDTVALRCPFARPTPPAEVVVAEAAALLGSRCGDHALGADVRTLGDVLDALYEGTRAAGQRYEGDARDFELARWRTLAGAPTRICEIGLNRGTSAAAWLCAFPRATLLSFDVLRYNASVAAAAWLRAAFPGRFELVVGDTTRTLAAPHVGAPCDVVSIDGGHSLRVASSDLRLMRARAAAASHLLLMDDVRCAASYCADPTRAWEEAVATGAVLATDCQVLHWSRGWCWGRYAPLATQRA